MLSGQKTPKSGPARPDTNGSLPSGFLTYIRGSYATIVLHEPVEEVLQMLGVKGHFEYPDGNVAVVGDPDFLWVMTQSHTQRPHPKVIVRKTITCVLLICYINLPPPVL